MNLSVEAGSSMTFDIELEHKGERFEGVLVMNQGTYELWSGQDLTVIGRRVTWQKALCDALLLIQRELDEKAESS